MKGDAVKLLSTAQITAFIAASCAVAAAINDPSLQIILLTVSVYTLSITVSITVMIREGKIRHHDRQDKDE